MKIVLRSLIESLLCSMALSDEGRGGNPCCGLPVTLVAALVCVFGTASASWAHRSALDLFSCGALVPALGCVEVLPRSSTVLRDRRG